MSAIRLVWDGEISVPADPAMLWMLEKPAPEIRRYRVVLQGERVVVQIHSVDLLGAPEWHTVHPESRGFSGYRDDYQFVLAHLIGLLAPAKS